MTAFPNFIQPVKSTSFLIAVAMVALSCLQIPLVFADAPAVTDFGQDTATPAMASSDRDARAMFVTLYADGRQQWEVRQVRGDAVASFAGEHPVWHLDHGLMWFVHMPVYVREVGGTSGGTAAPSV